MHSTVFPCLRHRQEGMAASTNCSSHVKCCATLRTYFAQFVIDWVRKVHASVGAPGCASARWPSNNTRPVCDTNNF